MNKFIVFFVFQLLIISNIYGQNNIIMNIGDTGYFLELNEDNYRDWHIDIILNDDYTLFKNANSNKYYMIGYIAFRDSSTSTVKNSEKINICHKATILNKETIFNFYIHNDYDGRELWIAEAVIYEQEKYIHLVAMEYSQNELIAVINLLSSIKKE